MADVFLDESFFEKFGVELAKDEIVFCEFEPGNHFYFIQSGKVKIVKFIKDQQKTIDVLESGDFFGEMAILEPEPRSATAVAAEPVRLLKFHKDNFEILLQGNPQLAYKLLIIFSKRIFDAKRRLMILLLDDPQLKVMDVLLMLSSQHPSYLMSEEYEVSLDVTAEDVASWAAMSESDVEKVLTHLVQVDKIELYGDKIVVKNIMDFERILKSKRQKK